MHICLLLRIEKETQVSIYSKYNLIEILVADIIRDSKYVDQLTNRFALLYTILYYHQTLML
jgi:hypothetical protein